MIIVKSPAACLAGLFLKPLKQKRMDTDNKIQSRKKFLGAGLTAAALFTTFRFLVPRKTKKPETIKMLSQDGKLVEVDADMLYRGKRNKITDDQLKTWVNKKKS